jgi:23S rRNA (pseudouridine1915-N3)-methyltransferase
VRVHVLAVGRLRTGPERDLVDDYLSRFEKTGRGLGLTLGGVIEVEDRKSGGKDGEAHLLRKAMPEGAALWALDERGRQMGSPDFAQALADERDTGRRDVVMMIGGADGLQPGLRSEADRLISFGAMVWPHMLARVMLSEQLYRAATILSGGPYHRA